MDEPRRTVENGDKLVAAVMQRLAEGWLHSEKQQKSKLRCLIPSANLLTPFVFDSPSLRTCERRTVFHIVRCYISQIATDCSKLLGMKNLSATAIPVQN